MTAEQLAERLEVLEALPHGAEVLRLILARRDACRAAGLREAAEAWERTFWVAKTAGDVTTAATAKAGDAAMRERRYAQEAEERDAERVVEP